MKWSCIVLQGNKNLIFLTHWGRVTHICVGKLTIAWPAPSHYYLNQWWNIVNWTLRNKLQWNLNRNSNIFIQENAFGSVVCETAAILSRPQCVNRTRYFTFDWWVSNHVVDLLFKYSGCITTKIPAWYIVIEILLSFFAIWSSIFHKSI